MQTSSIWIYFVKMIFCNLLKIPKCHTFFKIYYLCTVIPVLVAAAFNNFATKNPLKFDTYAALILGRLLKYTVNRNLVIFYCLFSRLLKLGGSYHAAAFNTGITVGSLGPHHLHYQKNNTF